ncbi:MAG TPA: C4-type zinc ribbon domain-containing protein [Vicinamibacterales bacterium]|nr:C4-type zinc ribbon domain-containing protein [Vicinamibacterales bacterium]
MHPDLDRLIRLQALETRAAGARRRIASAPTEIATLDARLSASRDAVTAAKQRVADNKTARGLIEKDLAAAQQKLSKYKEQLMAVKTNHEYHAMQHQIESVTADVARVEEQILVNMLEADDAASQVKSAEAKLKNDEQALAKERAAIQADATEQQRVLDESESERAALVPDIPRNTLDMFERVLKARQGIALAEAQGGMCTVCRVGLRPQVYNTVLRNDQIIQCDHCQRVLYFAGVHQRSAAGQAALDAANTRQIDSDTAP